MVTSAAAIDLDRGNAHVSRRYDVVVIGGGQAGLATGYSLKQRGLSFVILDERERVGDNWRSRWDSLRMFTPAKYDGLPGMRFPLPGHHCPTSQQMADYLETYVATMGLPVHTGVRADGLWPANDSGDGFVVTAGDRRYEAEQVVIATGTYGRPSVPDFAGQLDPGIHQLHSSEYQRPSQLREGGTLVVGGGNSGAEIALELSRDRQVILVGRDPGQEPFPLDGWTARLVDPVIWFVVNHVLTLRTPLGRKVSGPIRSGHAAPVARAKRSVLKAAGVERIHAKTVGVRDGMPLLDDGRVIDMPNVIWCTGFRSHFDWIHLPVAMTDGYPDQNRGVVPSVPGLYFVGLPFLYSFSSMLTGGVGRDAEYIAREIASRAAVRQ